MCMWQVVRINRVVLVLFFVGVLSFSASAQNQPIKINIQLPAGVGLSAKSSQGGTTAGGKSALLSGSGISESSKVDYALIDENGTLIPLVWIQMKSLENTQFVVDIRDEKGLQLQEAIYFLNDQTDDLSASRLYESLPAVLQFDNSSLLIRNKQPRQTSVKAWLGISTRIPGSSIVLEYF